MMPVNTMYENSFSNNHWSVIFVHYEPRNKQDLKLFLPLMKIFFYKKKRRWKIFLKHKKSSSLASEYKQGKKKERNFFLIVAYSSFFMVGILDCTLSNCCQLSFYSWAHWPDKLFSFQLTRAHIDLVDQIEMLSTAKAMENQSSKLEVLAYWIHPGFEILIFIWF